MYMPYLMAGYAAALVMMFLGSWVAMRTIPCLRGGRCLLAAFLGGILSVTLVGLRSVIPAWASILLGNQALFVSVLLIYACVAQALQRRMGLVRWGGVLCLLGLFADAWYTYPHPNLMARILISSGFSGICAAATAWLLFSYRIPDEDPFFRESALSILASWLGWLQMTLAVDCAIRCVLTWLHPPTDFVRLDVIQAGCTWLNLLLYVATGCGLIWLSVCAHRHELQAIAQTDSLTGLLNRRAFDDILNREAERSRRSSSPLAVLLLDVDRFKEVNDSLGHHAGDEVLRRIGSALRACTRPGDVIARYGGEEFVLLLRGCALPEAEGLAERLRSEIAALRGLPGAISITASIGVSARQLHDSAEALLRRCDAALYGSKRGGRNLVTAHRPASGPSVVSIQSA